MLTSSHLSTMNGQYKINLHHVATSLSAGKTNMGFQGFFLLLSLRMKDPCGWRSYFPVPISGYFSYLISETSNLGPAAVIRNKREIKVRWHRGKVSRHSLVFWLQEACVSWSRVQPHPHAPSRGRVRAGSFVGVWMGGLGCCQHACGQGRFVDSFMGSSGMSKHLGILL